MLLVHAKNVLKPGKRDEFVRLAQPCIEASNKEEGIIDYRLYLSAEDENVVLFVEKYVDKAALKAHAQTEHLKALVAASADLAAEPMTMERFLIPEE